MPNKKIFFAAPFNDFMDHENGRMHESRIEQIKAMIEFLRAKGYEVYNAHEREQWGSDWYAPEVCTPLDFQRIRDSDILVAIPGNPASGGAHIELGWASLLEKRIIVLLEEGGRYSNLVMGLHKVGKVEYITYSSIDDCIRKIDRII